MLAAAPNLCLPQNHWFSSRKRFITRPNNSWIIGSAILLSWPEEICLELYIPVLKIDVCIGLELCNQSVKEDVMGWLVQRGDLSTAHHGPCINLHSHNHLEFQQHPCHCCWQNLCCICIDRSTYLSSSAHTTKAAIVAFNIFFRPLNTLDHIRWDRTRMGQWRWCNDNQRDIPRIRIEGHINVCTWRRACFRRRGLKTHRDLPNRE